MLLDTDFSNFLEPEPTLRQKFKKAINTICYNTGITWAYSQLIPIYTPVVFLYHKISRKNEIGWVDPRWELSEEKFLEQMEFLHKNRQVVSLEYLTNLLKKGLPIPPKTVALVFDDGYLSNLTIAAPILEKYQFPASFFIPTSFIDEKKNMWVDRLYSAFIRRTQNKISLNDTKSWHLTSSQTAMKAYEELREYFVNISSATIRLDTLKKLIAQLAPTDFPEYLLMNWEQIRELKEKYPFLEIGSHSHQHLNQRVLDNSQIEYEIDFSLERLSTELAYQPKFFSFPYSQISEVGIEILKQKKITAAAGNVNFHFSPNETRTLYIFKTSDSEISLEEFKSRSLTSIQPSTFWHYLKCKLS